MPHRKHGVNDTEFHPDGYVYVGVKPVVTTKEITLNIYDEVNHKQVEEKVMEVAADATTINISAITLPPAMSSL